MEDEKIKMEKIGEILYSLLKMISDTKDIKGEYNGQSMSMSAQDGNFDIVLSVRVSNRTKQGGENDLQTNRCARGD
jgi:hypothetical protein